MMRFGEQAKRMASSSSSEEMARTQFTHHTSHKIRLLHQAVVEKISSSSTFLTITQPTFLIARQYFSSVIGDMDLRTARSSLKDTNNTKILILKRDSKVMMISSILAKVVDPWPQVALQCIPSLEMAMMK